MPDHDSHGPEEITERRVMLSASPPEFRPKEIVLPVLIAASIILIGWLLLKFLFLPKLFGG